MTKTFDTIGGSSQFMIGLAVGVWLVLILVIIFSASRPHYSEVEKQGYYEHGQWIQYKDGYYILDVPEYAHIRSIHPIRRYSTMLNEKGKEIGVYDEFTGKAIFSAPEEK